MSRSRKKKVSRKTARRRRLRMFWRITKVVGPLLVIVSVGGLLYRDAASYLNRSERYRVRRIEVSGMNRASEQAIVACSGIMLDAAILSVDREQAAAGVAGHHRISDATVAVTLPDLVSIKVVEREPIALVVFNKPYEIGADGLILGQYEKGLSPEGPIISGLKKPRALKEGVQLKDQGLAEALELWRIFSADPVAKELTVSEIDISDSNSLIMLFANKRYEMRWPREGFTACMHRLKAAWEKTGGFPRVRSYIDLRFDEDVPTK